MQEAIIFKKQEGRHIARHLHAEMPLIGRLLHDISVINVTPGKQTASFRDAFRVGAKCHDFSRGVKDCRYMQHDANNTPPI